MTLKIDIRETPDAVILDVHGPHSMDNFLAGLRDTIREVLAGNQKNILLNLADVPYIDAAGAGELIGSYTTVVNAGGRIKLLNLQKRVQELLQMTKLLTIFETFTSETDALRSFAAARTK